MGGVARGRGWGGVFVQLPPLANVQVLFGLSHRRPHPPRPLDAPTIPWFLTGETAEPQGTRRQSRLVGRLRTSVWPCMKPGMRWEGLLLLVVVPVPGCARCAALAVEGVRVPSSWLNSSGVKSATGESTLNCKQGGESAAA